MSSSIVTNVLQTVDANGNATPVAGDGTTAYTYDRAGRLTAIDYSDATPDVSFTYDNAGNRLSMVDGSGTETRTYDPVNRLLSVARGSDTLSYAYDLAGNLTQRTYPGSVSTTYTYDLDNRLATAVNASLETSYGYDVAGNLTQTTLPSANGYAETRVYDASGRLTEVKNQKGASVLSRFVMTRDPVGNPASVDRTGGLTQLQTYTYDANDRISTICFAASCTPTSPNRIAWTYDLVGNRLTETRASGTVTSTYNAGDQLLSAGSTSYTYDSNGNQLSAASRTFGYDLANRLRTTTQGSTTTAYLYDGEGKRLLSSTGSAANKKTNFLWDVSHSLPQIALERDGSGALQRQYVYGLQRVRQSAGTASYYHYDGLGSVANLTSASGATQWTWSYEPYGPIRSETKASGNQPDNFLKFTGEYLDPTGLYHLRARQYDPVSGRFVRRDPVEPTLSEPRISPYVYGDDRPTVMVDPTGAIAVPETPSIGGTMTARLAGSAVDVTSDIDPTAGDDCTVVPDKIESTVGKLELIDFSFSCRRHDQCYGRWMSWRRGCDTNFGVDTRTQCSQEHPGFLQYLLRKGCNKVADLYHYGVEQLGNLSWFDKAERYDNTAPLNGCPYSTRPPEPDVQRCRSIVKNRSYPPFNPDVQYVTQELLKQLAEIVKGLANVPRRP